MITRFSPMGRKQANLHGSVDPRSSPRAIPSPLAMVVELRKLPLNLTSVQGSPIDVADCLKELLGQQSYTIKGCF